MGTTSAKSAKGSALAVFGAGHGTPYKTIDNRVHQKAPDAFRMSLEEDAAWLGHWDWDFDGPLLPNSFKAVDLGNLATKAKDGFNNRLKIRNATAAILRAGAIPMMFGGDDSTPIPFIEGFALSAALEPANLYGVTSTTFTPQVETLEGELLPQLKRRSRRMLVAAVKVTLP